MTSEAPTSIPAVGHKLDVELVEETLAGGQWHAVSDSVPLGWDCTVLTKGLRSSVPGLVVSAWILSVDSRAKKLVATTSNRGFLPISDRKRPEYLRALRVLVLALEEVGPSISHLEAFSEVKGMFNRVHRRDQWDWHAVSVALGRPSDQEAIRYANLLTELRAAVKRNKRDNVSQVLEREQTLRLLKLLKGAIVAIETQNPQVPAEKVGKVSQERNDLQRSERTGGPQPMAERTKRRLRAANAVHGRLLEELEDHLESLGYSVDTNKHIDAYTRLRTGPAYFEAKSIDAKNELSQVRKGISQLYEYRYRYGEPDASLWLLLSEAPTEQWMIDYLEKDRDIRAIWFSDGQLKGLVWIVLRGAGVRGGISDD